MCCSMRPLVGVVGAVVVRRLRFFDQRGCSMSDQWFIVRDGAEQGPINSTQLKSLADDGQLTPADQIRRGDMQHTVRAEKVKGLFVAPELSLALPPQSVVEVASENERRGWGRFVPESALIKISKPIVAVGITAGVFVAMLLMNICLSLVLVTICAALVYYDAASNKIGRHADGSSSFFSLSSCSSGMWDFATAACWLIIFPLYLIKRPALINKANESPIEPSGFKWKMAVFSVMPVLFSLLFLAAVYQLGVKDEIAAGIKEDLEAELNIPIKEVVLVRESDSKFSGAVKAVNGKRFSLDVTYDSSDGSYVFKYRPTLGESIWD